MTTMEKGHPMSPSSPQGRFTRHARAVGVLWCVFTLCFTIIVAVVFIQPHWVGAASNSGPGHIGLWRWCSTVSLDRGSSPDDVICAGELQDIVDFSGAHAAEGTDDNTARRIGVVNSTPFKAASLLVGVALVVSMLTIVAMLLFVCLKATTVFHLAGWMQIIAGAAVCVYPMGFNSSEARHLCGPTARQYNVGECSIRWAYVLAIIGKTSLIKLAQDIAGVFQQNCV
ncbi:Lipoma HMGIC fusion partner-like protein [Trinorchestia longiramus]|nr:Lipoma HMGIC fusion partner-like protein [Trinorchestia longiramus]